MSRIKQVIVGIALAVLIGVAVGQGTPPACATDADAVATALALELTEASRTGDLKAVSSCIERGANVNTTSPDGLTVLMLASSQGHFEIVKYLLEHGADVNAQTTDGSRALTLASGQNRGGIEKLLEIETKHSARKELESGKPPATARYRDFWIYMSEEEFLNKVGTGAKLIVERAGYNKSDATTRIYSYKGDGDGYIRLGFDNSLQNFYCLEIEVLCDKRKDYEGILNNITDIYGDNFKESEWNGWIMIGPGNIFNLKRYIWKGTTNDIVFSVVANKKDNSPDAEIEYDTSLKLRSFLWRWQ